MSEHYSYCRLLRSSAFLVVLIATAALIRFPFSAKAQESPYTTRGRSSDSSSSTSIDMRIVRIAPEDEAEVVETSSPNYSSFNLDSTRFLLRSREKTVLYELDPSSLQVHSLGFLFSGDELKDCRWSTLDANTVFGMSSSGAQIQRFDVLERQYNLVKDFSGILPSGVVGGFSKARLNDDRFSFVWKASELSPWRFLVVWDRVSDAVYTYDLNDAVNGMSGYRESYLSASGDALVIRGDVNRVWPFMMQTQASTAWASDLAKPAPRPMPSESVSAEFDAAELWSAGPRVMSLQRPAASAKVWDALPYQTGNHSRDGHFFIFKAQGKGQSSPVFVATQYSPQFEGIVNSVVWTNAVNCDATDNTVQKTSGSDEVEDSSATTLESIESGNGFIDFVASDKSTIRTCGFVVPGTTLPKTSDFVYGVQMAKNKKAYVFENGVNKAKVKYKAKNVFRIAIEGDVVKYYKNGEVFYTSGLAPSYPLLGAASLSTTMSSVTKATMFGGQKVTRVNIKPTRTTMSMGDSKRFTATVTGTTNTAVVWSANSGSITADGTYTAPSVSGRYMVTATSVASPSSFASATVDVGLDTTPPTITNVVCSAITSGSALVTWSTNEASDSQLDYGTTSAYGSTTPLDPTMVLSHQTTLSGLSPSTQYHYRVRSRDALGNLGASADFTFTTSAPTDTTPPVISGVATSAISASGATVSWTTDEASDSQVEYGTTTAYGVTTAVSASMVTAHSSGLSGLSASTTYHFRVKSKDAAGNPATSGDFTFTTSSAPDTTPPVISGVASSSVTSSGATISWTTNEAADSQVEFGSTTAYGSSSSLNTVLVASHSVSLTGLSASTLYHYRVKCRDGAGNLAVSGDFSFTTAAPPDTTPPVITGVSSSGITASAATISWTTNEASDSQVDFGSTSAYGSSSALDTTPLTSHAITLNGLSASTLYHYRVKSRDAAGNLSMSSDFTFTTSAPADTTPPVISSVASSGISTSGAMISWSTNENSDTQVDYGTTTAYGSSSTLNTSMVTAHSSGLSGLAASTLYHYRVKSRDTAGNLATSGDFTFTTAAAADTTPPVISGVSTSGTTSSGNTVNWTTNESSDSQVDFGTSTAYGSTMTSASMVTSHSVVLSGLSASTLYHYRVKSRDAAGNLATSGDFTFTTSAGASGGGNLYVSTTGSDSNPGTQAAPFRTIDRGIRQLGSGQTLMIRGGTYAETIRWAFPPSGTDWSSMTTIKAFPGESVVLQPPTGVDIYRVVDETQLIVAPDTYQYISWENLVFDGTNVQYECVKIGDGFSHQRFLNCEFRYAPSMGILCPGEHSQFNQFINCFVHDVGTSTQFQHGFYLEAANQLVDGCTIDRASGHGIHLYGSSGMDNLTVRNCTIRNCERGIGLYGGRGHLIYNNVVINPTGYLMLMRNDQGDLGDVKIYNNTFYRADTVTWSSVYNYTTSATLPGTQIRNNIVFGPRVTLSDDTTRASMSNNITTDPLFVNLAGLDLHLRTGSPAIDTGVALFEVPTDHDGVARPQGAGYDIGAYERSATLAGASYELTSPLNQEGSKSDLVALNLNDREYGVWAWDAVVPRTGAAGEARRDHAGRAGRTITLRRCLDRG